MGAAAMEAKVAGMDHTAGPEARVAAVQKVRERRVAVATAAGAMAVETAAAPTAAVPVGAKAGGATRPERIPSD